MIKVNTKMILLSALLLVAATGPAMAANLLVNGDFETGDLSSWNLVGLSDVSSATVEADNGPAAPGVGAAFLNNQAMANGLTMKQTTLPGSGTSGTVDYSFDLKLGQAAAGGVFFVEIFAEQEGVGIIGGSGLLGNYTPAGWTTFTGSFEAPANTDFFTIQFTAVTGAVDGSISTMYIDNVSLDQGTVADEPSTWGSTKALYR